jgi:hypothetical protein
MESCQPKLNRNQFNRNKKQADKVITTIPLFVKKETVKIYCSLAELLAVQDKAMPAVTAVT